MKIAVYTSCAVNYYAKARVLLDSIRKNSPDTSVTLVICDMMPLDVDPLQHGFDNVWSVEDLGYDRAWIFKHNIMELCTAVKGHALEKLMAQYPGADLYVYLDPDVYVYEDLASALSDLGDSSIGLIPHILWPEESDIGVRMTEMSVTEHGIYNLGHLFVRGDETGRKLATWWRKRLDEYCYDDREIGLFTDQRWMDLVPAIFDNVRIIRKPVYDVASWNLFGKNIQHETDTDGIKHYNIRGDRLVTYHFSGTGPTGTHARVRQIFAPASGAAAEIERDYENAIAARGQRIFETIPPAYDFFSDGTPVKAEARKLYRRHDDLQRAFPDPYDVGYLAWLRERKPAAAGGITIDQHRARAAFEDLFDAAWYCETYDDVRRGLEQGRWKDALHHYIDIGSSLLYDPNPYFVTNYYYEKAKYHEGYRLDAKPRSHETTLLWHYLTVGLPNGIEPVELFDSIWYIQRYEDLYDAFTKGAILTPLSHFIAYGDKEGRCPHSEFSPLGFLDSNPAARAMVDNGTARGPLSAYIQLGYVSGRVAI